MNKFIPGINDLATVNPKLAAEWHPTKNGDLLPSQVMPGSRKKAWWICDKGHEWEAQIANRNRGHGCSVCAGKTVLAGVNDFASLYPELAKEWHPTKNGTLLPSHVTFGSHAVVWWRCPEGHDWEETVNHRTGGTDCPYCYGQRLLRGFNDLATKYPELAAEWHPTKNGDLTPDQVTAASNKKIWWLGNCGHEWEDSIAHRSSGRGCTICGKQKRVNARRKFLIAKDGSLATVNPSLAAEWHPTKNGELTPSDVLPNSRTKVWWQCSEGHEWQSAVSQRYKGVGCPYCAGQKVWPGSNDLATTRPELAAEWHPTKNGDLLPSQVTFGSNKKVWWFCKKGHEWQASPNSRSKGTGCPVCSGRKVLPGFNDLASLNPSLATEWHPTKNGDLMPSQVTSRSNKKVWWRCSHGHEWQSTVSHRFNGVGCPYCAGQRVSPGSNKKVWQPGKCGHKRQASIIHNVSLATVKPELAAEWHPTKNGSLTPAQVRPGSGKKIWWRCSHGHEWQALVSSRSRGCGCPECAKSVIAEKNVMNALARGGSLGATHPKLAAEWHPTKNGDLLPSQVTFGSRKKVWWQCAEGHEWQAQVSSRSRGCGCPECAKSVIAEKSVMNALARGGSLAATHPELVAEWHPTKNGDLTPEQVTPGSNKKVWWRCPEGHEWEASPNSRTNMKSGCRICAGKGRKPRL